jgi:chromate transporter
VTYGTLPQVNWLFYGIQPVVVAIVANAIWSLGRTILKRVLAAVLAVLILVLYLLGINALILLFGGAILYGLLRLLQTRWKHTPSITSLLLPTLPLHIQSMRTMVLPSLVTGLLASSMPVSLFVLFLTFLKLGAIVYGSGYTLLAFLRTDLVQNLHWLTDKQLLDAVSIGQFTPGPVFTTATFIGYLLAGLPGAILATVGIFLPSFVFIAAIHPVAARLRKATWTATLLDGINAAALALMIGVLVQLGQHALEDVITWGIALVSFVVLLRWKVNSVWLIIVGAVIGVLRFWLFKG